MKQRTTKIIALVAMALFAVSTAFAQLPSGGGSNYPNISADNKRGEDWELVEFGDTAYSYFKGNAKIDGYKTTGESVVLGKHWMGNALSDVVNDTLYLCNVATGEYMQVGEYWGETGMINHVGLPYLLVKGYSQRKKQQHVFPGWKEADGYYLQITGVRDGRVIGRMSRNDGKLGHFEFNKFLAMRDMDEYDDGYVFDPLTNDWGSGSPTPPNKANNIEDTKDLNPGGFLFQFHPVQGDKGEQEYVIYTHRKTDMLLNADNRYDNFKNSNSGPYQYYQRSEYWDRDSYLLLTNAGPMTADYNSVRFVKFAGDMGDPTPKTATLSEGSESVWTYGDFTNSDVGDGLFRTFTTSGAAGMAGVTVKVDASIMGAAQINQTNYGYAQRFVPGNNDAHTITLTAPVGYVITGYSIQAITHTNDRPFTVTPQGGTAVTVGAPNRTPINVTGLDSETTTFTIQSSGDTGDATLYFPVFNITVKQQQLGDEIGKSGVIDLTQGLATAAADPNNRWKLVTKKERDRQRIVASEDQPMDATSRIKNPKFYTSFTYNWKKSDCTEETEGHFTIANDKTAYGWQWYDHDTETHPAGKHHVHPYDADYSNHWTNKQEHHKIGTGHFWRTGQENFTLSDGGQEFQLTYGQEANYCGSIFKGSANVQQTISGLREGLYVVYVRGFYAPHDMTKYTIEDWTDDQTYKMDSKSTKSLAPETWRNEAYYTDTNDGKKKWHRSHDSYLFAWSHPKGRKGVNEQGDTINLPAEEVRRMLPSIYEGAVNMRDLGKISRSDYMASDTFQYTMLGNWYVNKRNANNQVMSDESWNNYKKSVELMEDKNIFAVYGGAFFTGGDLNWVVPKTVTGAARFFNAVDESLSSGTSHKNASNYRIGLPVYVGSDGELTIGVEHYMAENVSNSDEWVCFDDFELLYMGKVEPDEFVIDEIDGVGEVGNFPWINGDTGKEYTADQREEQGIETEKSPMVKKRNNTQWIDLFDPTDISHDLNATLVKKVVLRRTMPKDGWSSIVLPVSLTLKHVKEMFGENVGVSKLSGLVGRTIMYTNQTEGKTDNDIVIRAGVPYIVRPSKHPDIVTGTGLKYYRPMFTKAYSTSAEGVAGYYLKNKIRNYEIEREMEGPIWVATDVTITSSESFPKIDWDREKRDTIGDGSIWTDIVAFESNELQIDGKPELGNFKMVETAVYEPGGTIPANSYYHAGGKMYFTTGAVTNLPRGLYSYIQMIRQEDGKAYAKPFVGGDDYFIEVVGGTTGIEDINQPLPDAKVEIYDLQGRKVTNPGRGIYIVNGVKTVFN